MLQIDLTQTRVGMRFSIMNLAMHCFSRKDMINKPACEDVQNN